MDCAGADIDECEEDDDDDRDANAHNNYSTKVRGQCKDVTVQVWLAAYNKVKAHSRCNGL